MTPRRLLRHPARRLQQRGAATLVVVMVLFLVMALLAGYANRSLVFEQRIANGYYRASVAQEMSEGGVDWTVAMLNGTAVDGSCAPVATGGTRFVDMYLNVSAADRSAQRLITKGGALAADCARTGNALVCRCPAANARTAQAPTVVNGAFVPTFGVQLATDTAPRYGNFLVNSQACSDGSIDVCRSGTDVRSKNTLSISEQVGGVAFIAAVPTSPSSPLTVRGTLTTTGSGGLGLHNSDPTASGSLVLAGGALTGTLLDNRMDTLPGTPASMSQTFNDSRLSGMNAATFFQSYMGMTASRYANHPAARVVTCPAAGDCGPALLAAYDAGQRILLVNGPLEISSNVVIGTVARPVVILANGAVVLNGPFQLTGLLGALGNLDWVNTGGLTSQITGMVLVQDNMTADGAMDIVYRQDVADQLRNRVGSYARVSGGLFHSTNTK